METFLHLYDRYFDDLYRADKACISRAFSHSKARCPSLVDR